MIRQTIDRFRKSQNMDDPEYEIYNYSDPEPPKVLPHRHRFYEFYFLLCEGVEYFANGQIYHLKKGDLLLVPPEILHYPSEIHLRTDEPYARIVLWCQLDFFDSFSAVDPNLDEIWETVAENRAYHLHLDASDSSRIHTLLNRLLNEHQAREFASRAMCHALLLEIFVLISRCVHSLTHFERYTPAERLFDNVISYIHLHITEDLSLDSLSGHFYVSKGYLSRLFREYTDISVHQYILSMRLEACRKAIKQGESISEVSALYGFQDYSCFYRAFRNAFLMSPKAYQKSCEPESAPDDRIEAEEAG